jgi:nicotinamide riboside transporter PnuC
MLSPLAYWLLLAGVSAYAFLRGRFDERLAAVICIVATLVTWLFNSPLQQRFSNVEGGVLAADTIALVGFTLLALRSERFWPLWVAGLQLTTILAHGLKAVNLDLVPQAYAAAARFWVYPIFLIIVIGTWRSHRQAQGQRPTSTA